MRCWTRLGLSSTALALALGACSTPPEQIISSAGHSDSSSTDDPTTTTPSTTTTGENTTGGSQGGTGMDTTTIGVDATSSDVTTMGVDPSTSSDGTTMGVDPSTSSSSEGPPPECMVPGDCPNNETCDMGMCVPACNPWGAGHYDYCLTPLGTFDSAVLCGEALSCLNAGNPTAVVVCGRTCATQCDCAGPPPTGDATVTCGGVTGGGNRCYLSCTNGETCPDDMVCQSNGGAISYCTHPVQDLDMYGNCGAVASGCANGGLCAMANDGGGGNEWAICVSPCGVVGDCDVAPAGAAQGQGCGQVYPPGGNECHLDCSSSADCLPGMTCIDIGMGYGNFCMWNQ